MDIYKTVNCYLDKDLFSERLKYLATLDLKGIRCNLSKLSGTELVKALQNIKQAFSTTYNFELLIDIAYPFFKPRIVYFDCNSNIITDHKYYILKNHSQIKKFEKSTIILSTINFSLIHLDDIVYYSDGSGAFKVTYVSSDYVEVIALNDFTIHKNKSISFSFQENQNLITYLEHFFNEFEGLKISFLFSFVSCPDDINIFRSKIKGEYKIISKIESMMGINNLDEIAKVSSGLLIARGDLAIYEDYSKLFFHTNKIAEIAKENKIDVYCATDILLSMAEAYLPNRADIIDISYNLSLGCNKYILPNYMGDIERVINVLNKLGSNFGENIEGSSK